MTMIAATMRQQHQLCNNNLGKDDDNGNGGQCRGLGRGGLYIIESNCNSSDELDQLQR